MPEGSPYILASVGFSQLEAVKKEDYLSIYTKLVVYMH